MRGFMETCSRLNGLFEHRIARSLEAAFVRPSDSLVPEPDRVKAMQRNFNACFQQLTVVSGLHHS
jgi:hypothetical protein